MTSPENPVPAEPARLGAAEAQPGLTLAALADTCRSLRAILHLTLVILLIVSATLLTVLFHQVRMLRSQAYDLQRAAVEMAKGVDDYETNSVPLMERFSTDLKRFADRNPDFAQIMGRYQISSSGPRPTNAPPATTPPGRK